MNLDLAKSAKLMGLIPNGLTCCKYQCMTISVLAFGIAREIMGGASVAVTLDDTVSAGTLKDRLTELYPRLGSLSSFAVAVNGVYAEAGVVVRPGDEVAIIPPVSGG